MPVLKVKRGEKKALQVIAPALQQHIIPLMEIVERKSERVPNINHHLDTAFKDLDLSIRPYARFLFDTREIAPDGPAAVAEVYRRAATARMRLTRAEFEAGELTRDLRAFLSRHGLAPEELDLVVDLGAVEDLIAEGVANLTQEFLAAVPDQTRWRTLTVTACAFPMSMRGVDRHSSQIVERAEWRAWR